MKTLIILIGLLLSQIAIPKESIHPSDSVIMLTHQDADSVNEASGFIIAGGSGKLITITNAHVCRDDKSMTAHSPVMRQSQELKILKIDAYTDLCALEAPKDIMPMTLGYGLVIGRQYCTLGYPAMNDMTLSCGRLKRYEQNSDMTGLIIKMHTYFGNSGGPVFDKETRTVIGVVSESDFTNTFVITAANLRSFLSDL